MNVQMYRASEGHIELNRQNTRFWPAPLCGELAGFVSRKNHTDSHYRYFGVVEISGVLLRFSQFPDLLPLEASFLGEHNVEVLSNLLGYGSDAIAKLEEKGVWLSRANN